MSRAINPKDLLDLLLEVYWEGGIEQGHAAKLIGIQKKAFAALASFRQFEPIFERAAWAYYLEQFNYAFPECDRRAVMRPRDLKDKRSYTDAELLAPPKRELSADPLR